MIMTPKYIFKSLDKLSPYDIYTMSQLSHGIWRSSGWIYKSSPRAYITNYINHHEDDNLKQELDKLVKRHFMQ